MRKNLTNGFSILYIAVDILLCLFGVGLLVYSLFFGSLKSIVLCSLYVTFNYLFFFRKIGKFKEIRFDKKHLYFDQKAVSYKDISKIKFGRIEFRAGMEDSFILFMTIPIFNTLDELIENHEKHQ